MSWRRAANRVAKGRTATIYGFIFLFALAVIQIAFYYLRLPDVVASHFNAKFEADGWMKKRSFILIYAVLAAAMASTGIVLTLFSVPQEHVVILLSVFGLIVVIFQFAFFYNTDRMRRFLPGMVWGFLVLHILSILGAYIFLMH